MGNSYKATQQPAVQLTSLVMASFARNQDMAAFLGCTEDELKRVKDAFKAQMQDTVINGKPFLGQLPSEVDTEGFYLRHCWDAVAEDDPELGDILTGRRVRKGNDWEERLAKLKAKILSEKNGNFRSRTGISARGKRGREDTLGSEDEQGRRSVPRLASERPSRHSPSDVENYGGEDRSHLHGLQVRSDNVVTGPSDFGEPAESFMQYEGIRDMEAAPGAIGGKRRLLADPDTTVSADRHALHFDYEMNLDPALRPPSRAPVAQMEQPPAGITYEPEQAVYLTDNLHGEPKHQQVKDFERSIRDQVVMEVRTRFEVLRAQWELRITDMERRMRDSQVQLEARLAEELRNRVTAEVMDSLLKGLY